MQVELIKKEPVLIFGMVGGFYFGRPYLPILFGARFKNIIATGKTASEAINNCVKKIYEKKSLHS